VALTSRSRCRPLPGGTAPTSGPAHLCSLRPAARGPLVQLVASSSPLVPLVSSPRSCCFSNLPQAGPVGQADVPVLPCLSHPSSCRMGSWRSLLRGIRVSVGRLKPLAEAAIAHRDLGVRSYRPAVLSLWQ
jgi:hypothetical protein